MSRRLVCSFALAALAALPGCSTTPISGTRTGSTSPATAPYVSFDRTGDAAQIVMYAYGLLGTGYRFGGRNPEAGLDCSGMVSYIVEQVSGKRLPHNAARIAGATRPIDRDELQPGDLVFFNTLNRPHSHMGIYLGEDKFIHAPSSQGEVRVEAMSNRYFSARFDGARTLQPAI